jgi:hypothetical protein
VVLNDSAEHSVSVGARHRAAPAHSQIYFTRYIGAGLLVPTPVARRLDADGDAPGRPGVQEKSKRLKIGQCYTVLSTVGLELERLKHESINSSTLCTASTVRPRGVDGLMLCTVICTMVCGMKGAQRIPSADSAAQSM